MKKVIITKNKIFLNDDITEIREGVVKKIGNGGMVLISKKYIGKKVYVLLKK